MNTSDSSRKFPNSPHGSSPISVSAGHGALPIQKYVADSFTISLYDDWKDKTIYTISGPVTDGIQHSIIINLNPDVETDSLRDYADWQIASLTGELKGCRLLFQGLINLDNGLPAYKAIFCWYPTEELRIYQEQIYVLVDTTGYNLTASFTKKTRKTLGPQVERMMLSFNPVTQTTSSSQNR